ncbi:hypothetical protein SLS58_006670 [Diplodia intermedia]|uniref:Uncharacterized protein n=1 Tax=Diplodia intermedia TaxID=856260 RepID=A0ABR3TM07_9PEZI
MSPAKEVDPPPLLPREETTVEGAATLQGTEGVGEVEACNPVSASEEGPSLEQRQSQAHPPSEPAHLDELSAPSPAKDGDFTPRSPDLEGAREESHSGSKRTSPAAATKTLLPTLYIHSYLVFFSMLGTLARLGLQAITIYPGAPVALGEIWANVAGTLVMGYLAEDRLLFHRALAPATQRVQKRHDGSSSSSSSSSPSNNNDAEHAAQLKKEHMAIKKTIPAYIGLTVGFCGSLTTFSSFMRDAFLALSNDLNTAPTSSSSTETLSSSPARSRNAGYSVEALLAVLILEVAAGLAALSFGAHAALYSERLVARFVVMKKKKKKESGGGATTRATTTTTTRSVLDPLVAVLAWPMWLGAALMAIWPPHGAWRGQAVFALVFAPAGCVARFRLAAWLNGRVARFPAGTFAANGGSWMASAAV